jgi:hypothetical protein
MNSRAKLYWLVLTLCLAGYCWLGYSRFDTENLTVCPMKIIAGVPCPSCGTTRSVERILHGHFMEAMVINPFGCIAFAFLIVAPLWILLDLFQKSSSFFLFYQRIEKTLQAQTVYIPLIILCLLNWYWNIMKEL